MVIKSWMVFERQTWPMNYAESHKLTSMFAHLCQLLLLLEENASGISLFVHLHLTALCLSAKSNILSQIRLSWKWLNSSFWRSEQFVSALKLSFRRANDGVWLMIIMEQTTARINTYLMNFLFLKSFVLYILASCTVACLICSYFGVFFLWQAGNLGREETGRRATYRRLPAGIGHDDTVVMWCAPLKLGS